MRVISNLQSILEAMAAYEKIKNTSQNIEYAYLRRFDKWGYKTIKVFKTNDKLMGLKGISINSNIDSFSKTFIKGVMK